MFDVWQGIGRGLRVLALAGTCSGCGSGDGLATKGPDPQCNGCYVVNAAITGNATTIFVGGYMGETMRGFVRRYQDGDWGTLVESPTLDAVQALWADDHQLWFTTDRITRRVDLDGFAGKSFDIAAGAIWGSGSGEVFALGEGVVHHFNGEDVEDTAVDLGAPRAVTGSSATDVYALDSKGGIEHFDGTAWAAVAEQAPAAPTDLWAVAGDNVLAVAGDDNGSTNVTGRIMRYGGGRWQVLHEAPHDVLLGVAAARRGRIYAVGGSHHGSRVDPVVWRFDGKTFTRHVLPGDAFLWDVFCGADDACRAVGTDNTFVDLEHL